MKSIKTQLVRANVRAGEGVLQCVAVCRNMLQCSTRNSMCHTHTVTHTQTREHARVRFAHCTWVFLPLSHTLARCHLGDTQRCVCVMNIAPTSVPISRVACSTLQHTATHCNTHRVACARLRMRLLPFLSAGRVCRSIPSK